MGGVKRKVEPQHIQGLCLQCKRNKQTSSGFDAKGRKKYRNICSSCFAKSKGLRLTNKKAKKRQLQKEVYCQNCKFVALHPCQLDVDHIDGNHENDHSSNLQTLCANCHRLKTFLNKDWEKK